MFDFRALKLAVKSLSSNKVRTFLTVLGIVIGITSVIVVFSAGEGIRSLVIAQVETFGTDFIETEVKVPSTKKGTAGETQSATALAMGVQVTTLTLDDMEKIKDLPNINDGYGAILSQEQVSYGNTAKKINLMGVSSSYIDIDKSEVEFGRCLTESEDESLSQVAVIGSKVKEDLFGDSEAIGKSIKIKKTKFRVIGTIKERGAYATMDFDNYIYVPVKTIQKKVMGIDHILYMVHQLKDLSLSEQTADETRSILRERHDITDPEKDDFRVTTVQEAMEILGTITGAITLLLLAIVAISLLVGGVGIMNIMYVIVTERTAEIGLRKAVGAKYIDIMLQFLSESIILTLIGGVVGIILGSLLSYLIYFGASSFGLAWKFSIPIRAFFVSIGFSAFFGIVFGLYPARKAAKLDPITALRKE